MASGERAIDVRRAEERTNALLTTGSDQTDRLYQVMG